MAYVMVMVGIATTWTPMNPKPMMMMAGHGHFSCKPTPNAFAHAMISRVSYNQLRS
jgi:hypothetical protein